MAVRWYLAFPVSYRDLAAMLFDRGVSLDHTTLFRWIQAYAATLERRARVICGHVTDPGRWLKPTSRSRASQIALKCVQAKRRVVLVNRESDLPSISAARFDNYLGGQLAASHLLDMQCARFAFPAGSDATTGSGKRESGFADGLRAAGLTAHVRESGNYNYHSAVEAARRLLSREERPDAIFSANDIMAVAVLDVARREFGLTIPQDLAGVGFDNTPLSAISGYDMTSVDQDISILTTVAVKKLLDESEEDHRQPALIPCRIEIRRSSLRSDVEQSDRSDRTLPLKSSHAPWPSRQSRAGPRRASRRHPGLGCGKIVGRERHRRALWL